MPLELAEETQERFLSMAFLFVMLPVRYLFLSLPQIRRWIGRLGLLDGRFAGILDQVCPIQLQRSPLLTHTQCF